MNMVHSTGVPFQRVVDDVFNLNRHIAITPSLWRLSVSTRREGLKMYFRYLSERTRWRPDGQDSQKRRRSRRYVDGYRRWPQDGQDSVEGGKRVVRGAKAASEMEWSEGTWC